MPIFLLKLKGEDTFEATRRTNLATPGVYIDTPTPSPSACPNEGTPEGAGFIKLHWLRLM